MNKISNFAFYCIVLCLIGIAGYAIYSFFFNRQINFEKIVNETNERLEYVKMSPYINLISNSNEKPERSYKISIKPEKISSVIDFKLEEYSLETGGSATDAVTLSIDRMFVSLDSVYNRKNKIIDAISEFEFEAGAMSGSLLLISEILYSIRRIAELKLRKVEILVKGYADGQRNNGWSRPLIPPYNGSEYKNFWVHPEARKTKNPYEYLASEINYPVPDNYENQHLPNLRARHIQLDFIERYLNKHIQSLGVPAENISTGILNGYVFTNIDSTNRKVEIYLNIN